MGNQCTSSAPLTTPRLPPPPPSRRRRSWRSPTRKAPHVARVETPAVAVLNRMDQKDGRFLARRAEDLEILYTAEESIRRKVTSLVIDRFFLTREHLIGLKSLPNLVVVKFDWAYKYGHNIPLDEVVEACATMSMHLPNNLMIDLDLSSSGLTNSDVIRLSKPGVLPPALTGLNMRRNRFGWNGAKHILCAVSKLSNLTTLDLSQNRLGCEVAPSIVPGVFPGQIKSLNLEETRIGDGGVDALSKKGVLPDTLRLLNLKNCNISEKGACFLSKLLLPLLDELNLSGNDIGHEGVKFLVTSKLPKNLKILRLEGCGTGHYGAELLVDHAKSFPYLEMLFLRGNGIKFSSEIYDLWEAFTRAKLPGLDVERFRHPHGCNPDSDPDFYEKCEAWESWHREEEERFLRERRHRKMKERRDTKRYQLLLLLLSAVLLLLLCSLLSYGIHGRRR